MPAFRPFSIVEPASTAVAIVLDSPHSGMSWPDDFAPAASREAISPVGRVPRSSGRRSCTGATCLPLTFPRASVDVTARR